MCVRARVSYFSFLEQTLDLHGSRSAVACVLFFLLEQTLDLHGSRSAYKNLSPEAQAGLYALSVCVFVEEDNWRKITGERQLLVNAQPIS